MSRRNVDAEQDFLEGKSKKRVKIQDPFKKTRKELRKKAEDEELDDEDVEPVVERDDDEEEDDIPHKKSKKKADDDDDTGFANDEGLEGEEEMEEWNSGYKMEPFNLSDDREKGKFDSDGNYVWFRQKEEAEPDRWLQALEEEEKNKKGADSIFIRKPKKEDDKPPMDSGTALRTLANHLKDKESVTVALRRLSKAKNDEKKKDKNSKMTKELEKELDLVTECADTLLASGHYNIYSDSRENILKKIGSSLGGNDSRSSNVSSSNNNSTSQNEAGMWQYKSEGKTQGPFSTEDIISWYGQGYFQGENIVPMRRIIKSANEPESQNPFINSNEIDFSQYYTQPSEDL